MRDVLVSNWVQVRADLLRVAANFTDDELSYRPAPRGYSVGETLLHIANEEDGELRYGITRELPAFPPAFEARRYPDRTAIVGVLDEVHARTLSYMQGLSDRDLDAETLTPWGERRRTSELLLHIIQHEIHHRGELSLVLGLLDRDGLDA